MAHMDLVLYLFADEDVVRRAPDEHGRTYGILNGLLKVPPGGQPGSASAALTVESTQRPPRVVSLALHPAPAAGTVSSWMQVVPLIDEGVHTAHWTFAGAESNRVALRIVSGGASGAALTIEAIPSIGVPFEPHLFARLRNLTGAPLDRPSVFADCAAIIDGVRSRFQFDAYHGAAELAPGDSLGHLFSLDRCEPRPAPGAHDVMLEMAGHRSPAVRVVTR
jgi:hypothetical protein